ncbi:MAG: VanZ family protein [Bacteroidetes bacterium]|nr:VanZ family protein [Bacteroidota bacterium]
MNTFSPPFYRRLFWFYILGITVLALLPLNTRQELNHVSILSFRGDHFFHSLVFIPLVFLLKATYKTKSFTLLIGLCIAALMEGIQQPLSYRTFTLPDMLANMLGVCIGFVLLLLYRAAFKSDEGDE